MKNFILILFLLALTTFIHSENSNVTRIIAIYPFTNDNDEIKLRDGLFNEANTSNNMKTILKIDTDNMLVKVKTFFKDYDSQKLYQKTTQKLKSDIFVTGSVLLINDKITVTLKTTDMLSNKTIENEFTHTKNESNLFYNEIITYLINNFTLIDSISLDAYCKQIENIGDLKFIVTKFKNNKGKAYMSLYNSADGFPADDKKAFKIAESDIKDKKIEIIFEDLPYGNYGFVLFHDENLNGKYEEILEGYTVSNNKINKTGMPLYKNVQFDVNTPEMVQELIMYNF